MSKQETTANARVTVTLIVDGGGPWGDDCTLAQMHRQAAEHATDRVRQMIQEYAKKTGLRCELVTSPVVELVSATRTR